MVRRRHLGVDIEIMMSREGKLCDEYPINNEILDETLNLEIYGDWNKYSLEICVS